MNTHTGRIFRGWLLFAAAAALLLTVQSAGAAGTITTYAGNTVELSGSATGSDYVYLVLIGPNLPSGGVSLEDLSQPAISGDPSTFLRLTVKNNRWSYKWRTTESGRILDNGNYIIYIVNQPKNRNDLSKAEYSYINVQIKEPTVTAHTETGDKTGVTATLKPTTDSTQSQTVTQAPTQVPTLIPTPAPTQAATPANTEVTPSPQATDTGNENSGDMSTIIVIGAIAAVILVIAIGVYAYSEKEKKKRFGF